MYDQARAERDESREGAIEVVVQTILQSPFFMYHIERGETPTGSEVAVPLADFEVASRLSYFLWSTMPDEELFAAADLGRLGGVDELEAQARRMLDDPRAKPAILHFFGQWWRIAHLDTLYKETALFPEFDDALREAMRAESEAFITHVIWDRMGLETLFTAPYSFVNEALATLYGIGDVTGTELREVELDAEQRIGLLGHARCSRRPPRPTRPRR